MRERDLWEMHPVIFGGVRINYRVDGAKSTPLKLSSFCWVRVLD